MSLLPPKPWSEAEDASLVRLRSWDEAGLEAVAKAAGRTKAEVRYRWRWLIWRRNFDRLSRRTYVSKRRR